MNTTTDGYRQQPAVRGSGGYRGRSGPQNGNRQRSSQPRDDYQNRGYRDERAPQQRPQNQPRDDYRDRRPQGRPQTQSAQPRRDRPQPQPRPDRSQPPRPVMVPDGLPDRFPPKTAVTWKRAARTVYAAFNQIGDDAVGYVSDFDLDHGETLYQSDQPCGYLDLWAPPDRLIRVRLDSGRKRDRVADAEPKRGKLIRVRYIGQATSRSGGAAYKDYEVEVGVVADGEN